MVPHVNGLSRSKDFQSIWFFTYIVYQVFGLLKYMAYQGIWFVKVYGLSNYVFYKSMCFVKVYSLSRYMFFQGIWFVNLHSLSRHGLSMYIVF